MRIYKEEGLLLPQASVSIKYESTPPVTGFAELEYCNESIDASEAYSEY